jgi:hypothetical protein
MSTKERSTVVEKEDFPMENENRFEASAIFSDKLKTFKAQTLRNQFTNRPLTLFMQIVNFQISDRNIIFKHNPGNRKIELYVRQSKAFFELRTIGSGLTSLI